MADDPQDPQAPPAPAAPKPAGKVDVFCTNCGQRYSVPAGSKGSARCKKCGQKFSIG